MQDTSIETLVRYVSVNPRTACGISLTQQSENTNRVSYSIGTTRGKNVFDRAAFIGLETYTRLIRYSDIHDLRSKNQRFGALPESLAPEGGPFVVDEHDNFITIKKGPHKGDRIPSPVGLHGSRHSPRRRGP